MKTMTKIKILLNICLKRISSGQTFVFGIEKCLVYMCKINKDFLQEDFKFNIGFIQDSGLFRVHFRYSLLYYQHKGHYLAHEKLQHGCMRIRIVAVRSFVFGIIRLCFTYTVSRFRSTC